MNICQIIIIYPHENKNYRHKTIVTVEPGTGSIMDFHAFARH
jgi:hypothetical protein